MTTTVFIVLDGCLFVCLFVEILTSVSSTTLVITSVTIRTEVLSAHVTKDTSSTVQPTVPVMMTHVYYSFFFIAFLPSAKPRGPRSSRTIQELLLITIISIITR